jgi:hypothetical protein
MPFLGDYTALYGMSNAELPANNSSKIVKKRVKRTVVNHLFPTTYFLAHSPLHPSALQTAALCLLQIRPAGFGKAGTLALGCLRLG